MQQHFFSSFLYARDSFTDARARMCVRLPGMQMLAKRTRGLGLLRAYVRLPGNANISKVYLLLYVESHERIYLTH